MDRHFVVEGDNPQEMSQLWYFCPEAIPIVLLSFGVDRLLHNTGAPLLFQVRALSEHFVFKVIRESIFCHWPSIPQSYPFPRRIERPDANTADLGDMTQDRDLELGEEPLGRRRRRQLGPWSRGRPGCPVPILDREGDGLCRGHDPGTPEETWARSRSVFMRPGRGRAGGGPGPRLMCSSVPGKARSAPMTGLGASARGFRATRKGKGRARVVLLSSAASATYRLGAAATVGLNTDGVRNTTSSRPCSNSSFCLNSQPSTGMSPMRGTLRTVF